MKIPQTMFFSYLMFCVVLTIVGYAFESAVLSIIFTVLVSALWALARRRQWRWVTGVCFVFFVFQAFRLSYRDLSVYLPFFITLFANLAWNVEALMYRLESVDRIVHKKIIIARYVIASSIVIFISLISVIIAANLTYGVDFIWIIVLSLIALASIARMGKLSTR